MAANVEMSFLIILSEGKMRVRPSARLLIINPSNEVLLFRFNHTEGARAGESYWATPGGGLETGETFYEAAMRELFEETGVSTQDMGGPVLEREFELRLSSGEVVRAVEQYFIVNLQHSIISRDGWTAHEVHVMTGHRWWSENQLKTTKEIVWPEMIRELLLKEGIFSA